MLPTTAVGLGFAQDIAELLHLTGGSHEDKAGLTAGSCLGNPIEPDLKLLELDADICIFGVQVAVAMDLAGEPSVIMVNEGIM